MSDSIKSRSVGRLSRLGIGTQVLLSAFLALVAVLLINWLAGRPGIRQRFDLTATSRNTLSTATLGLLARLEGEVKIDILYRPMEAPLTQLGAEVILRTEKLLVLMETEAPDKIDVEAVNTSDLEAWTKRQQELRLRGYENGLIVSRGDRRVFLALAGDLAMFDMGNPVQNAYVPPRVRQFNAEEAIVEAILDVTKGAELHAYFTFGYGEPDALETVENDNLGLVSEELERDGFRVHRWNYLEDGPLPEDCSVVVAVGPQAGWPDDMYSDIVEYVERGGRLVVAPETVPELLRKSDVPDLMEHFGFEVSEGRVMRPALDRRTGTLVDGQQECELHYITGDLMTTHPMLSAIRSAGSGFAIPITHQVRVGEQPPEGVAQHLFSSTADSWIDAPPCDRRHDPKVDSGFGAYPLGATVQRPPMLEVDAPAGLEAVPEIRVVALGSESVFSNAAFQNPQLRTSDLMRAAFNWVADREHRITVPPRDPDLRFLPPDKPESFVFVTRVAQIYLPAVALLAGILVWFLRVRGSRRTPSPSTETTAFDAA